MRKILVLATLAAGAIGVACSGGNSSGPATSPSPAASAASTLAAPTAKAAATGAPASALGTLPADVCALLTPSEVQRFATGAAAGVASQQSTASVSSETCSWDGSGAGGALSVTLGVSTLPPGASASTLQLSLESEVRDAGPNGAMLSGLGDVATYTSVITANAEVKVVTKGLLVILHLVGANARANKDLAVSLATAAIGRL